MFKTSIKNILINIGYIIVILMFFYTIGLALNTKQIVENFDSKKTSPSRLAETMEDLNITMKDDLNIGKHRAAYQDALSQIQENINLTILKTMTQTKDSIPNDKELNKVMKLKHYRDTAEELEDFLDGVRE